MKKQPTLEALEPRQLLSFIPVPLDTQYEVIRDFAVGDLNGDFQEDVATISNQSNPTDADFPSYSIQLFANNQAGRNDGSGPTPPTAINFSSPLLDRDHQPMRLVVGDLNGDGLQDLLVLTAMAGSPPSTAIPFLNQGDWNFTPGTQTSIAYNDPTNDPRFRFDTVLLQDLNLDGNLDLVSSATTSDNGGAIRVALGNGDGTFGPATYHSLPSPQNPQLGDVRYTIGQVSRIGTFRFYLTDATGDGVPDVITLAQRQTYSGSWNSALSYSPTKILVLPGNSDGSFGAPILGDDELNQSGLQVADFNGDGITDIVTYDTAHFGTSQPLIGTTVRLGSNNGKFDSVAWTSPESPLVESVDTIADFNGDGIIDLNNGTWLGAGDGTFTRPAQIFSARSFSEMAAPLPGDRIPLGTTSLTTHSSQPQVVTNYNGVTRYDQSDPAPLQLYSPIMVVQRGAIPLGRLSGQGPFTIRVDWGDGSSSTVSVPTLSIPAQSHLFAPGQHTIRLAASDPAGNVAYNTITVITTKPTPPPAEHPMPVAAVWNVSRGRAVALTVAYSGRPEATPVLLLNGKRVKVRRVVITCGGTVFVLKVQIPRCRLAKLIVSVDGVRLQPSTVGR